MIRVFSEGDAWLVWDCESVKSLREDYKIIGNPSLTAPNFPQQSKFLGLPLELTPYECKWCFENGACELCKPKFKHFNTDIPNEMLDQNFRKASIRAENKDEYETEAVNPPDVDELKFRVFCELKSKGYWITGAENYGCDFAVYLRPPWECHADAFVWCSSELLDTKRLILKMRIAEATRKKLISATLQNNEIRFIQYQRYKNNNDDDIN